MGINNPPSWMLNDHYAELAKMKDVFVRPEPDWDHYLSLQREGRLVYVVARDDASSQPIVGYAVVILDRHPHYQNVIVAFDDLHYLMPFWRGSGYGKKLLQTAEKEAANAGAKVFRMRLRYGSTETEHERIYRSMGYEPFDVVWVKSLMTGADRAAS